jgi:HK97 family phage major capsid protein
MPLNQQQKDEIAALVGPIVKEAIATGVTPIIQEELKKATAPAADDDAAYSARIARNQRDKDLLEEPQARGIAVARIAMCMGLARNDQAKAVSLAKSRYTDDLGAIVVRTLQSNIGDEGGVFVPSILASEFIDALRAEAAVRRANPRILDLTGGNLTIPRVVADATAGWVGEARGRNASNMTTGDLVFNAKRLQAKSPMSQDLARRSSLNAEQIMRDNMVSAMANTEDQALLAGTGSAYQPRGMLNWAALSVTATQAGASATLDEVMGDLREAIDNLTNNNVPLTRAVWFESFRSRNYKAFQLKNADDKPPFKEELLAAIPQLNGQQAYFTNNIPNNLGAGSNRSRVYLANMNGAWLAEEAGMRIRASNEASFTDATGTLVSAFDLGLTIVIIERDIDFAMAHDEDVTVIEEVRWGA